MALVITNGNYYVCYSPDGGIRKTSNFDEAIMYENVTHAIQDMYKAPSKTASYYVYDTITQYVCWKWLTDEERVLLKNKQSEKKKKKNIKRKNYSQSVRKMIYEKADGRCRLCGRKIKFEEMTLDHVIPLVLNGVDSVENLQCSCVSCNQQKGSYLPEDFFHRISEIFLYQLQKKCGNGLRWKIVHRLLENLI